MPIPTPPFPWAHADDLQAYDSHMNLVLGDVVETIYIVDDDENEEEIRVNRIAPPVSPVPLLTWSARPSPRNPRCSLSEVCLLPPPDASWFLMDPQAIAWCSSHRTTPHEHP